MYCISTLVLSSLYIINIALNITIRLADNEVGSLSDVVRLRPLMDLVTLSLNGNPIYDLPHAQSFIINVLPSLDDLDEEVVDPQMRENAKKRSGNKTA